MRFHACAVIAVFMLSGGAAPASDGPPPDKEKKKQKDPRKAPRVFTDEDLKKARETQAGNVTVLGESKPAPSPEPSEAGASPAPAADALPTDESGWRNLAGRKWKAVRTIEQRIRELEARITDLTVDRNPSPPDLLDPSRLQKREAEKAEAVRDLEAARAELATAQRELEELQARARDAKVPEAWLAEPEPDR